MKLELKVFYKYYTHFWLNMRKIFIPSVFFAFLFFLPFAEAGSIIGLGSGDEFPAKSVMGASQVAVCSGKPSGLGLTCKFGNNIEGVSYSLYSMAANGWKLVAVTYDVDLRTSHYYFSLN
jgi:hypothetical protein